MTTDHGDGTGTDDAATPPPRERRGRRAADPADVEAARAQWAQMRPWDSPMARADKVLLGTIAVVIVIGLASFPLRPFLIASYPVALAAVTGSLSAIGAGSAFARVGEVALWAVVAAGIFGMIKFDWLFWWAGRRWGAKGVRFFIPSERAQRFVERVRGWPVWAMALLVVVSALPGIPALLVHLLAGLAGMRLLVFLLASAVGAGIMTGLVAGLGYGLGQDAVDVVLAVDRYAVWISLGIVLLVAVKASREQSRKAGRDTEARQAASGD